MTVSTTTTRDQFTGTGANTALSTTFAFNESSEVVVTSRVITTGVETTLTETTHYTVAGGSWATGTVTPVDGATDFPSTVEWTLERQTPITQSTDWVENDDFPAQTHEQAADKLTFIAQERSDKADRALRAPTTDDAALDMELPNAVDRASLFLAFDADGEPIASAGVTPATVTVSAYGATLIDDEGAGDARVTLDAQEDVIAGRGDMVVGNATPAASALSVGAADTVLTSDGTDPGWGTLESLEIPLPRSYLAGLAMTIENSQDINVGAGICRDSTDTVNMAITDITKQIDATWVVGDDVGGLCDTDYASGTNGTEASTWYNVFVIAHTDGTVDVGFDKSATAVELLDDTGYTYFRRIGSVFTDTAGPPEAITAFTQYGDTFLWDSPVAETHTGIDNTPRSVITITAAANSTATVNLLCDNDAIGTPMIYVMHTDQADLAPSATVTPLFTVKEGEEARHIEIYVDASSQIGARSDEADIVDLTVVVLSYTDRRGRDD